MHSNDNGRTYWVSKSMEESESFSFSSVKRIILRWSHPMCHFPGNHPCVLHRSVHHSLVAGVNSLTHSPDILRGTRRMSLLVRCMSTTRNAFHILEYRMENTSHQYGTRICRWPVVPSSLRRYASELFLTWMWLRNYRLDTRWTTEYQQKWYFQRTCIVKENNILDDHMNGK